MSSITSGRYTELALGLVVVPELPARDDLSESVGTLQPVPGQRGADLGPLLRACFGQDGVAAGIGDRAAHVDDTLVHRIGDALCRVAAHDHFAPANRGRRRVAGMAGDDHRARQETLGDTPSGRAVDLDLGSVAHPAAVVADRTIDADADVAQDRDGQVVPRGRVAHLDFALSCADEAAEVPVDLADREAGAVDDDAHRSHGTGAAGHSALAPIFQTVTAPAPASRAVYGLDSAAWSASSSFALAMASTSSPTSSGLRQNGSLAKPKASAVAAR